MIVHLVDGCCGGLTALVRRQLRKRACMNRRISWSCSKATPTYDDYDCFIDYFIFLCRTKSSS
jgi:hypothetical protein